MKKGKGCSDCGCFKYEAAYYMVQNSIWNQVNGGKLLLCLSCLVKRLGRKLIRDDFTNAHCNKSIFSVLDCVTK